jgi:hypothetical protein
MGRRPFPEGLREGPGAADRGPGAEVRLGSGSVTAHYDSVPAVREALEKTAMVDRVEALGCLVPGPGYEGFARRHPIAMGLLAMAECVVRTAPVLRGRGDHTLFEFTKR